MKQTIEVKDMETSDWLIKGIDPRKLEKERAKILKRSERKLKRINNKKKRCAVVKKCEFHKEDK